LRGSATDVAVEAFGASNVEADNEVWPDFHPSNKTPLPGTPDLCRNPSGWANFPDFVVTRRWQTPSIHPTDKRDPWGLRYASLLELEKIRAQRHPRES
jgi:hypothetical protein